MCKICISIPIYNSYNLKKTEIVLKMIVPLMPNNSKTFLLDLAHSVEAQDLSHVLKMHVTLIPNNGKSFLSYFIYSIEAKNLSCGFYASMSAVDVIY